MNKRTITLAELADLNADANRYLESHTDMTKIKYVIEKNIKKSFEKFKDYNDCLTDGQNKIKDIEIDYCEADDKGNIIYDVIKSDDDKKEVSRFMKFTKENKKKCNAKTIEQSKLTRDESEKLLLSNVEVEFHLITDQKAIDALDDYYKEAFRGFYFMSDKPVLEIAN